MAAPVEAAFLSPTLTARHSISQHRHVPTLGLSRNCQRPRHYPLDSNLASPHLRSIIYQFKRKPAPEALGWWQASQIFNPAI